MKSKFHLLHLLFFAIVLAFILSSCSELGTANSSETGADDSATETSSASSETKHSEMNEQEYSDFVLEHSEHLDFINAKKEAIRNEAVKKTDQFNYECENGTASLERSYNAADQVHLLSYIQSQGDDVSSKQHFFWEDKLIFQYFHHSVKDGENYTIDDHQTFFKDGKMLKCLERKYSYKNGDSTPNIAFELVDCDATEKLTKDIEGLITKSKEEAKSWLCM